MRAGDLEVVKNYATGNLYVAKYGLTSLEGCPKEVTGYFRCHTNQLTSFEGAPEEIIGKFDCSHNQISSFEYFPKHIFIMCDISKNLFTSFKDIDQYMNFYHNNGILKAYDMNITSGFSDLFGVGGLCDVQINDVKIKNIVNKHIFKKDLIEFQDEMIKSGYESYL